MFPRPCCHVVQLQGASHLYQHLPQRDAATLKAAPVLGGAAALLRTALAPGLFNLNPHFPFIMA